MVPILQATTVGYEQFRQWKLVQSLCISYISFKLTKFQFQNNINLQISKIKTKWYITATATCYKDIDDNASMYI